MSVWKERANVRREIRQEKPEDRKVKPKGSRKDTKKWCGGKEGREHKLECRAYKEGRSFTKDWKELVCTVCGKVLGWYAPTFNEKPEWVKDE